jgi:hypothetical protein
MLGVGLVVLLVGAGVTVGVVDLGPTDSDGDGLSDAREREIGTDPTAPDTDGDRLPDGWEANGETDDGVPLPDADPLAKDVYVQVSPAGDVTALSDAEHSRMQRAFRSMPVANPANESGVELHLVAGDRLDPVVLGAEESRAELLSRLYTEELLGDRQCVYHHLVLAEITDEDVLGYGDTPGYLAVVDGTAPTVSRTARTDYAVHELLHNVVGRLGDGASHADHGWLSGGVEDSGWARSLDGDTRRALSAGFADGRSAASCGD